MAGIEALLALRSLAGDLVHVTLASPAPEFIYKPLTVEEPFSPEPATRRSSSHSVAELGVRSFRRGCAIDADRRIAELDDSTTLDFDAAIVYAQGAAAGAFAGAGSLRTSGEPIDIDALLRRASSTSSGRMAFIVPPTGSWPLPVWLALWPSAAPASSPSTYGSRSSPPSPRR